MKIAFASYEYPAYTPHGGIAFYVQQASRMLAGRGHDVHVFTAGPRTATETHERVKVHLVGGAKSEDFGQLVVGSFAGEHGRSPFAVIECPDYGTDGLACAQANPEVAFVVRLHTPRFIFAAVAARQAERRGGLRVLLRRLRHGAMDTDQPRFYARESDGEYQQAQRADLLLSPSVDLARRVTRVWDLSPTRVRHVPYAFAPAPALLAIDHFQRQSNRILFLGRLEERKGLAPLTAALRHVLRRNATVRVDFVGRICPEPKTGRPFDQWILGQLGVDEARVKFHGPQPNASLPGFFGQADVCVFPSLYDNFPVACLEAMAAGCAIVASNRGGMKEQLDSGGCGIVLDPEDDRAWAEALLGLLSDPARRRRLGADARARVLQEYAPGVIAGLHEQAFAEAIERCRQRQQ